eukprot:260851_1
MPYSDEQVDTLVTLNILASTFSFLGAIFIIANFFGFEEFKNNYAFKYILFVAIGDVINSVGNFMGSPSDGSAACFIQAFLTQFGDIFSFAWVTAIAWVIFTVIRREVPPTEGEPMKWYRKVHIVIWTVTLILSILPATTGNYGNDNGLCWIKHDPHPYGEIWRMLCFYIPLWASILYVAIQYKRIWSQLTAPEIQRKSSDPEVVADVPSPDVEEENPDTKKHAKNPSTSDIEQIGYGASSLDVNGQSTTDINETPKSGGGTLQRIKYYPFVMFGCYFFATIRRFAELGGDEAPFWIAACQVFTSALLGTCNAILYGFTPVVRNKDSEWIRSHFCKEPSFTKAPTETYDINSDNVDNKSDAADSGTDGIR